MAARDDIDFIARLIRLRAERQELADIADLEAEIASVAYEVQTRQLTRFAKLDDVSEN